VKKWKPRVFGADSLSGSRVWMLGIEFWVQEHELHMPWGSRSDGADRHLVLHLGWIGLQWTWEVRS
jgi:hypothetical protein